MPETEEVVCTNGNCVLDLFEVHYTYDRPAGFGIGDLVCPVCREGESLEPVDL